MVVTEKLNVMRTTNGTLLFEYEDKGTHSMKRQVFNPQYCDYEFLNSFYQRVRNCPSAKRMNYMANLPTEILEKVQELLNEKDLFADLLKGNNTFVSSTPAPQKTEKELLVEGLKQLINFFKEFEFEPNFRFVNSLALALQKGGKYGKSYIENYFKLVDSAYTKEVVSKMKSPEWAEIEKNLLAKAPKNIINNRFKIYYGSAGTGKTTKAQKETAGRCVICNNSMLPADLMEDFIFVNGQPSFRPSMLWDCMEKGLPITLDEINLLPFEALRFLQGILDGKKEFTYKGNLIHIADGFQVIGTMNLVVNGSVFNLPEPLVDRASEMEEFKLTANQLLSAIM